MASTVPGGVYANPDGKTYHDANGNPVSKATVTEFKEQQAEYQAQRAEEDRLLQLSNPTTAQALGVLAQSLAPQKPAEQPRRAPQKQASDTPASDGPEV